MMFIYQGSVVIVVGTVMVIGLDGAVVVEVAGVVAGGVGGFQGGPQGGINGGTTCCW